MALTKIIEEDKIEVVGEYKFIQIREATIIKEDGKEISRTFRRDTINPGVLDASDNLVDTDTSSRSAEVRGIASAVWTQSVKDAYKAHLISKK
tara:strand:- start:198 stop:476 length:279 start_codon:yes stop_codon:yes gene_type:complete